MMWIDSHCHLDAPEFDADRALVRQAARAQGVGICVIPAVEVSNFQTVQDLALQEGDAFALGLHPLYVPQARDSDVDVLAAKLQNFAAAGSVSVANTALNTSASETLTADALASRALVAVGEIGLDLFEPALKEPAMQEKQEAIFAAQLRLAETHKLPVILHSRRAVDRVLKYLRKHHSQGGIAHAFNGSMEQAKAFLDLGFKLGFGGALTFPRASQLQSLAKTLPLEALVLETDAPDIVPEWLYVDAEQRKTGTPQARNTPAELPRIAQFLANLCDISSPTLQEKLYQNTLLALPKLAMLASQPQRGLQ